MDTDIAVWLSYIFKLFVFDIPQALPKQPVP